MSTFEAVVAAVGLVLAAAVADYRAITQEVKAKALGVYTVLGAAFTAFCAIYLPRLIDAF